MEWSLLALIAVGVLLLGVNYARMRRFVAVLQSRAGSDAAPAELPPALVILCLRGADPFLMRTLQCLRTQTFLKFELRIVIDSEVDPAWTIVRRFLQTDPPFPVQVRVLKNRRSSCSLKVSALLQEVSRLDEKYRAVVQLDADAVPYPGWLVDMLTPLCDCTVGAVSGLRWYVPLDRGGANRVRSVWGAHAMVQMRELAMAWGGSLAIRRELFEHSDLLDRWSRSLGEDLSLNRSLEMAGLKLVFVPAVLVNRESIDLSGLFRFARRQLVMVRQMHAAWPAVWRSAMCEGGLQGAVSVLAWLFLLRGEPLMGAWAIAVGLSYGLVHCQMLEWVDRHVRRRVAAQQGEVADGRGPLLADVIAALVLHLTCTTAAAWARCVEWRGVTYLLAADRQIRMLEDRPYLPAVETAAAKPMSVL